MDTHKPVLKNERIHPIFAQSSLWCPYVANESKSRCDSIRPMAEVIDPVAPLSVFTNININPNMDK